MKKQDYRGCVFNFGAGVQSVAIFMLLIHESDRVKKAMGMLPDYILFADTLAEKQESLKMFEYCQSISPIPMYRVVNWKTNAKISPYIKHSKHSMIYSALLMNVTAIADFDFTPIKTE